MKRFCSSCGNELKEESKFCDKCGQKIESLDTKYVSKNINLQPVNIPKKKNGCLTALLTGAVIFIIFVVLVIVVSQKSGSSKVASSDNVTQIEEKKEPEVKTITIGNTVNSKSYDITINKIEFTYDVLPDNTSGFYTHYPADKEKVYIHIDADIKNTQKQNLNCDKVMKVEANYNNGYTYSSSDIVEDTTTGFTYSNIKSINPLETQGMRFLIKCPQEVVESSNPLFLTFTIDGEKYNYTMR